MEKIKIISAVLVSIFFLTACSSIVSKNEHIDDNSEKGKVVDETNEEILEKSLTGEFFSYFVYHDMSGDKEAVVLKDAMGTDIEW